MEEAPLVFVERWTAELRSLQQAVDGKTLDEKHIADKAATLRQELTARAGDIPASELARCERELKALQDTAAATRTAAAPKSKFSFKRSTPAASSSAAKAPAPPLASAPPPRDVSTPTIPPTSLRLDSRQDAHLTLADLPSAPSSSSAPSALALSSLTRCTVNLLPLSPAHSEAFSALYLSDLSDCVILLPPLAQGSALLHNLQRCVLLLGAHQFRMHDSRDCLIALEASSIPIIERCRALVFAPYPRALALSHPDQRPLPLVQDFDDPFADPALHPPKHWRAASADEEARLELAVRDVGGVGVEQEGPASWAEELRALLPPA